jgi:hypothetical protein
MTAGFRTWSTKWRRPAVAVAAAIAGCFVIANAAPAWGAPAPSAAAQDQQTETFSYTGSDQTWTVPSGVNSATFTAYGAQGAQMAFNGGYGGIATSSIWVNPGDVIHLEVGGMGLQRPPSDPAQCILTAPAKPLVHADGPQATASDQTGGWNGGGSGGHNGNCGSAGGGGASDVRIGGDDLGDRKLVAGGGGGGSGNLIFEQAGGGGFPNGGSANGDGGGSGGDQAGHSGSGQLGQGSVGADPNVISGPGGGGGGGYYGGGGGQPGLAGGGGSSYGPTGTVFTNEAWTGNGKITVTFGGTPPTINDLAPRFGQAGSGIYVQGTNLDNSMVTTFGSTAVYGAICDSSTNCWVQVPPGSGTVSVRVLMNGQQTEASAASQFTYLDGPLTLSSISPQAAPPGAAVTLTGNAFVPDSDWTVVYFNGQTKVNTACMSATTCYADVPDGLPIGPGTVKVTTMAGSTNTLPFTVLPSVTQLGPAAGPAAGGTVVYVTGTGFSTTPGATTVTFGGHSATAVGCASTTMCTAVSPPGSGTVNVEVTVAGLQSPAAPVNRFTYGN